MSLVVGITGGIGSGKSTIAKIFEGFDIPVYHADDAAKELMNKPEIRNQIIDLLGVESYRAGSLNRDFVRAAIFSNDQLRLRINEIVHPEVGRHFAQWVKAQNAPYVLKEAAIIFESSLEAQYDLIITVVADKYLRVNRLLSRPEMTVDRINAIIDKQWSDDRKIARSDYVIYNNDLEIARQQAHKIHAEILNKSVTS